MGLTLLAFGIASNLGSNNARLDPYSGECAGNTTRVQVTGNGQTGVAGAPLGRALGIKVSCDDSGNGLEVSLSGQTVQWSATGGGGTANGTTDPSTTTDPGGQSQVHWSLGPTIGTQTLTAQVAGQTVTFTATGVLPVAGGTCAGGPGTDFGERRDIVGGEVWTLAGSPYRGFAVNLGDGSALTIEPGVQVCAHTLFLTQGSRLMATGEAGREIRLSPGARTSDPVTLFLTSSAGGVASSSVLKYVQAERIATLFVSNHAVTIEDSRFVKPPGPGYCSQVSFANDGSVPNVPASHVRRTVFDDYGGSAPECSSAVKLDTKVATADGPSTFEARVVNSRSDAVLVTATPGAWVLRQCDISNSGRHGLVFDGNAAGATVSGCSLSGNTGNGIENKQPALFSVDARDNWWGDPAGPHGAAGDGVSAGVDATSPSAVPPALGY